MLEVPSMEGLGHGWRRGAAAERRSRQGLLHLPRASKGANWLAKKTSLGFRRRPELMLLTTVELAAAPDVILLRARAVEQGRARQARSRANVPTSDARGANTTGIGLTLANARRGPATETHTGKPRRLRGA